ncbi:MAG: hypothetical protein FWG10_11930 [Eubacteriaceae bacterium]|nr:hypothetical protein [Eubacteriaceae bacterium]
MAGSFVLSVSAAKGCYRHIQIGEGETLYRLHEVILEAFDFVDDHLHAFFMNNRAWDPDAEFIRPGVGLGDAAGFSDAATLSQFQLDKDSKFLYIFDFGDEWRFSVNVLQVLEQDADEPFVVRSVGAVEQYPDGDSESEEEDCGLQSAPWPNINDLLDFITGNEGCEEEADDGSGLDSDIIDEGNGEAGLGDNRIEENAIIEDSENGSFDGDEGGGSLQVNGTGCEDGEDDPVGGGEGDGLIDGRDCGPEDSLIRDWDIDAAGDGFSNMDYCGDGSGESGTGEEGDEDDIRDGPNVDDGSLGFNEDTGQSSHLDGQSFDAIGGFGEGGPLEGSGGEDSTGEPSKPPLDGDDVIEEEDNIQTSNGSDDEDSSGEVLPAPGNDEWTDEDIDALFDGNGDPNLLHWFRFNWFDGDDWRPEAEVEIEDHEANWEIEDWQNEGAEEEQPDDEADAVDWEGLSWLDESEAKTEGVEVGGLGDGAIGQDTASHGIASEPAGEDGENGIGDGIGIKSFPAGDIGENEESPDKAATQDFDIEKENGEEIDICNEEQFLIGGWNANLAEAPFGVDEEDPLEGDRCRGCENSEDIGAIDLCDEELFMSNSDAGAYAMHNQYNDEDGQEDAAGLPAISQDGYCGEDSVFDGEEDIELLLLGPKDSSGDILANAPKSDLDVMDSISIGGSETGLSDEKKLFQDPPGNNPVDIDARLETGGDVDEALLVAFDGFNDVDLSCEEQFLQAGAADIPPISDGLPESGEEIIVAEPVLAQDEEFNADLWDGNCYGEDTNIEDNDDPEGDNAPSGDNGCSEDDTGNCMSGDAPEIDIDLCNEELFLETGYNTAFKADSIAIQDGEQDEEAKSQKEPFPGAEDVDGPGNAQTSEISATEGGPQVGGDAVGDGGKPCPKIEDREGIEKKGSDDPDLHYWFDFTDWFSNDQNREAGD